MFKIIRVATLTAVALGGLVAALPASAQDFRYGGHRFERDGGPRHHRFDRYRERRFGYDGPRFHRRFDDRYDRRRHHRFDY